MTLEALRHDPDGPRDASADQARRGSRGGRRQELAALASAFRDARASDQLVVLEGFHPLKHALRFGADVEIVVTYDSELLAELARDHAPELADPLRARAKGVTREDFRRLGPYEPHTAVVSIARRVRYDARAILGDPGKAPVVVLDEPRHRGNFGAVVRVAAAAGAAGVLSTGSQDPWHPVVVRGAAGLQFALPVARLLALHRRELSRRPLFVFDPTGEPFDPRLVPPRALLAFGSERHGVGPEMMGCADALLSLPMREGVSSLNLATSVAAVLYGLRLA